MYIFDCCDPTQPVSWYDYPEDLFFLGSIFGGMVVFIVKSCFDTLKPVPVSDIDSDSDSEEGFIDEEMQCINFVSSSILNEQTENFNKLDDFASEFEREYLKGRVTIPVNSLNYFKDLVNSLRTTQDTLNSSFKIALPKGRELEGFVPVYKSRIPTPPPMPCWADTKTPAESEKTQSGNVELNNTELNNTECENVGSAPPETAEYESVFNDEVNRRSRTVEEIRYVGISVGRAPNSYHVKQGGGYLTNSELETNSMNHTNFKKVSKEDEIAIIETFRELEGLTFMHANQLASNAGYTLYHVETTGEVLRNKAPLYDGTVLGVRLSNSYKDDDVQTRIVEKILDVGGGHSHENNWLNNAQKDNYLKNLAEILQVSY